MLGSTQPLHKDGYGISPIVGTLLMIAVVAVAISTIATFVLRDVSPPSRNVDFQIRVENTSDVREVRIEIKHVGGDVIDAPAKYLTVWGGEYDPLRRGENRAHEHVGENGFSAYGHFELGDIAVVYVWHDNANVVAGDLYRVWIYDNYAERVLDDEILIVASG